MGVMNEDRLTLYDGLIKTHITNTTVAKETGKGLSTNDYTTTEKNKLAGIAEGANKTIVDSALDASSENPVQNKVVKEQIDALTTQINNAIALRSSLEQYGMAKLSDSAAVTDSTGLALPATEKNAAIPGTLANQISQLNTDLEWKEVNQDISSLSIGNVSGMVILTISELINANEIVVHGSFGNNHSFIYPKGFLGAIEKTFNYSPIDTIYAKEGYLLINNETGLVKFEVSSSGSSNFAAEIFNIWYR